MDKEVTTKLLELITLEERVEFVVVINAHEANVAKYGEDPTAVNKKNMDASRSALNEASERLTLKYYPEKKKYENLMAVAKYLQGKGYKVKKSKLYYDRKKKLIKVQVDGSVFQRDVDAYAKGLDYLGDPAGGIETTLKRIKESEAIRSAAKAEEAEIDLRIKRKEIMSRSDASLEKAACINVMESNFLNMVETQAAAWAEIMGGNMNKVPLLINAIREDWRDYSNRLAEMDLFQVEYLEE